MTSISGGSPSGQGWSPMTRMQNKLQFAVDNGSVKAADQSALSAAITDIAGQLSAGAATTSATPAAPTGMKATITGMIDGEVSSGKLTPDQASELKSVFAHAGRHGHHFGGARNAPTSGDAASATAPNGLSAGISSFLQALQSVFASATPAAAAASGLASTSTDSATAASATATASAPAAALDPEQVLAGFLQRLQAALNANATYGANGVQTASAPQSILVNTIG